MNLYYFIKKYRLSIFLGPLFKLAESVFELIIPIIMANIIDSGIQRHDSAYIVRMGSIIIILSVLGLISAIICQYMAAKASQGIGTEIRNTLYKKINLLPFFQIDKIGAASLITRISSDVNNIQTAIAMAIRLGTRIPFITIGSVIMAYTIDKKLSLIFFVVVPMISVILYIITTKSSYLFTASRYKLDKLSSLSKENLDGCRVIRAFSRQQSEIERFNDANNSYINKGIKACQIFSIMPSAAYTIVNIAIIAIIWIGASRIDSGDLLPGKITALINYITQVLFALFIASSLITIFTKAYASYKRVFETLNIEYNPKDKIKMIPKNKSNTPKIEFVNVNFSYNEHGEDELQNISFNVMSGETLGIIGSTGSGKTSIVNLLLGFYDIKQGKILIDGINIKQYDSTILRKKVSIVPQNPVLFSGTIEENLRLGNKKINHEDIYRALDISQASEFVNSMPEGINSYIERGGKNLSGGQKQRLTIARAIVSSPDILILDDSMSALDARTSSNLKRAIGTLSNITKIIISQKCTNIMDADKIIVLDNGKIAGIGTHEYLLNNCETYNEIYKSQTE